MFVGVDNQGEGPDFVLSIDLAAKAIDNIYNLTVPIFDALWAKCDGSGVIGGVSFTPGAGNANGTATFGSVDLSGKYTAGDTVGVPAGFTPTGLLTGTSDAVHFLSTFFPQYTPTNATGVSGYAWAVEPYGGGSDDFVTEFGYYLIDAAWDTAA